MPGLFFSWNETKSENNAKKHGVTFDEAKSVFLDDYARVIPDPDHSDDEDRFIILGLSSAFRVLVVCHCYREDDHNIRIISARKANNSEKKQYRDMKQ